MRVKAAALNFFDLLLVEGRYQVKPPLPFTPGAEAAGIVDAVAANVIGVKPGERVIALPPWGAYAEYVICPAGRLLPVPAGMDDTIAATMPIAYQTAWFALADRAALKAGEWLLVHAGAGGVGTAAIQIGKALGARVIATAGSQSKLDFCREQGADYVFNYADSQWTEQVRSLTGRGADVIFDPVGGDVFDQSTRCIAAGGRLLVIGFASGRIPSIQVNRILLKNISIVGAIWGNWCEDHPAYIHETHRKLVDLWKQGLIRPQVTRTYAFEQAPQGLRDLSNRAAMGKSVLLAGDAAH